MELAVSDPLRLADLQPHEVFLKAAHQKTDMLHVVGTRLMGVPYEINNLHQRKQNSGGIFLDCILPLLHLDVEIRSVLRTLLDSLL